MVFSQVQTDISAIFAQIDKLDAKFDSFQEASATSTSITAVQNEVTNLIAAFNKAANTVTANGQLSEAETKTVLASVQQLVPKVTKGVGNLVARKPGLDTSPQAATITSYANDDVKGFQAGYNALVNAISSVSHSSTKASVDGAFTASNSVVATATSTFA